MASPPIHSIPIVTIQHDFETVIADVRDGTVVSEDFWISCYKSGETSVHGKVKASMDNGQLEMTSREGVKLEREGAHFYVSCPSLAIVRTRLRTPKQTIQDDELPESRFNRQINAFDVAPDLSQIALGFNDGSIHRLPLSLHTRTQLQNGARNASTTPQAKRVTYRAHVATITSLRYFPSSRVLLAASADFSLTILDAEISPTSSTQNGELRPVRTLKGHSRSVTDTSIISRGRNVLSCAKDGTVRLWDVGGGSQIRMMNVKNFSGVNAISVGTSADGGISDDGEALIDEREVETEDKVVYCALQNGAFEAIDLRTKRSTYNSLDSMSGSGASTRSSLTSIALSSTSQLLATGTSQGVISLYDTRSLRSTLASWRRNESPIESIAFLPSSNELAIATEDGLPYIADISSPNRDVIGVGAELVGGNCEAVRCLRINGGGVWTADEEGIVRTY